MPETVHKDCGWVLPGRSHVCGEFASVNEFKTCCSPTWDRVNCPDCLERQERFEAYKKRRETE